jgi:hypothetical protein
MRDHELDGTKENPGDVSSDASRNPSRRSRARLAAALAGLGALVALAFAPALAAGFVFDDRADVLDNPAATPAGFAAALAHTNRPLTKASYALQRGWTGAAPLPFHAANLLLHLAATLLVFAFVRRVVAREAPAHAELAAWLAAALWALHPAAAEAVAPVVGRSTLLSTVLALTAFLLLTRAAPPRPAAALAAGLAVLAAPLAREPRTMALRRALPALAGGALAALLVALSARQRELVAFSLATRSPLEALRGNVPALFDLAGLWLAPGRVSVDPAPPPDLAWSAPAMLAKLALLAALAALVFVTRRRRPALAFGTAWTLIAVLPSNSLVWRLDPVAPRALYLASIGPVLLAALAGCALARRLPALLPARRATAVLAAALVLVCALPLAALARAAERRARLWAEPAALWADAAIKAPARARPWNNLGVQLLLADRLDEAEAAFRRALVLDPAETNALCALDSIYIRRRTLAAEEGRP